MQEHACTARDHQLVNTENLRSTSIREPEVLDGYGRRAGVHFEGGVYGLLSSPSISK